MAENGTGAPGSLSGPTGETETPNTGPPLPDPPKSNEIKNESEEESGEESGAESGAESYKEEHEESNASSTSTESSAKPEITLPPALDPEYENSSDDPDAEDHSEQPHFRHKSAITPSVISPTGIVRPLGINYLGGYRYSVPADSAIVSGVRNGRHIYLGMDQDLSPVFMTKDTALRDDPKKIIVGIPPLISGTGSGVKVVNLKGQWVSSFVPCMGALCEGVLTRLVELLLQKRVIPRNRFTAFSNECIAAATAVTRGHPPQIPRKLGPSKSYGRIHPSFLPHGPTYQTCSLPVFEISPATIPQEAIDLIKAWAADHPQDLLYLTTGLQKTLQWLWITANGLSLPEPKAKSTEPKQPEPLPSFTLHEWLLCAHFYEVYHQVHELVWYIHPAKFVNKVLRSHPSQTPFPPDDTPSLVLEKLCLLLLPLSKNPLGRVIPSSFPDSEMEDLGALEPAWGFLPRSSELVRRSSQPSWRSLYFPNLPLWDCLSKSKKPGTKGTSTKRPKPKTILERILWLPSNWPLRPQRRFRTRPSEPDYGDASPTTAKSVTIFDRILGQDAFPEYIWGPQKMKGRAAILDDTAKLIAQLESMFAKDTPCWAVAAPTNSKHPVLEGGDIRPSCGNSPDWAPFPHAPVHVTPVTSSALLRLPPAALWGPTCVDWFYRSNMEALKTLQERGLGIGLTISPDTGLLEVDGAPEPPREPTREPSPPPSLVSQFRTELESLAEELKTAHHRRLWGTLPAALAGWLDGEIADGPLLEIIRAVSTEFICALMPLHMAYLLWDTTAPPGDWLPGSGRRGKITLDNLVTSMAWLLPADEDEEPQFLPVRIEKSSEKAKRVVKRLYDEYGPQDFPPGLRRLLCADEAFRAVLVQQLRESFGEYKELNWADLVAPMERDGEEPPEKRQRDGRSGGLIDFGF